MGVTIGDYIRMLWGLVVFGFRISGLGFKVWDCRVWDLGLRVQNV